MTIEILQSVHQNKMVIRMIDFISHIIILLFILQKNIYLEILQVILRWVFLSQLDIHLLKETFWIKNLLFLSKKWCQKITFKRQFFLFVLIFTEYLLFSDNCSLMQSLFLVESILFRLDSKKVGTICSEYSWWKKFADQFLISVLQSYN